MILVFLKFVDISIMFKREILCCDLLLFLDYDTLRALDSDNVPSTSSMSEEEINTLPVHKYKSAGSQR